MEFFYLNQFEKRKEADVLVLPYWKDKGQIHAAAPLKTDLLDHFASLFATKDFKAKEGEILYLYPNDEVEKRICLLGLGIKNKASAETLRRAYGSLTKSCLFKRIKTLNLFLPQHENLLEEILLRGVVEGLLLPNYTFSQQKHQDSEEPKETLLQKVTWIGPQQTVLEVSQKIAIICESVYYTRDLVNGNADDVNPQFLSQCALELAQKYPSIKTTLFDKKRIAKEKMGLLLAVNRGSSLDPAFIIMAYQGKKSLKDHTILVGKGITYDTGGLNLKQVTGGMDLMKCDMAGAAACFGIMLAVCRLKLKINLTVVIPATENCIDAKSFKPGDVYSSYSGKTVEMTNADAEGRLILADALAYAVKKLHPTRIIDIATLTGAIEVALGSEASGLMSTNDDLAQALLESGEATYERLWRMPLFDEYKERLKSDIADLKNWNGRSAGSNVAAIFLRQFVGETMPWAHLDIAGTAYHTDTQKYLPKYASGFGVRLIVDFLAKLEKKKSDNHH